MLWIDPFKYNALCSYTGFGCPLGTGFNWKARPARSLDQTAGVNAIPPSANESADAVAVADSSQ